MGENLSACFALMIDRLINVGADELTQLGAELVRERYYSQAGATNNAFIDVYPALWTYLSRHQQAATDDIIARTMFIGKYIAHKALLNCRFSATDLDVRL